MDNGQKKLDIFLHLKLEGHDVMERTNKTLQIDFNEGHMGFNFTPNKSTLLKQINTNIQIFFIKYF